MLQFRAFSWKRTARRVSLIGALAALALALPGSALATSVGGLDATFDTDGIATIDFNGEDDYAASVLVQPADSKIVAVGGDYSGFQGFVLARYNEDGTLDTAGFGSGTGKVSTDLGFAYSAMLQPDGMIVVVGDAGTGNDIATARYEADGDLDPTFGGGDGIVTTSVGTGFAFAYAVALQSDGKIVVGGPHYSTANPEYWAVVRYEADGDLDPTFGGGDSMVTTSFGSPGNWLTAIAIQSDGKIVAAGSSGVGGGTTRIAAARYTAAGALDTSFSGDGKQLISFSGYGGYANAIALQPDGKLLLAGGQRPGQFNYKMTVVRLKANGALDTSFSGDGKQVVDVGGSDSGANSVVVQPDGKIILGGGTIITVSPKDFALVRLLSNGSLDPSFDGDGKLTTAVGSGFAEILGMALDPQGRIVVGGESNNGANSDFTVARYANLESPANLNVAAASDDTIILTWQDKSFNETYFGVNWGLADGVYTLGSVTSPTNTTTHIRGGLACGTTYYFEVSANTTTMESDSVTTPVNSATTAPCGLLAASINGGFEDDTAPADGKPDGWTLAKFKLTDILDNTTYLNGALSQKIKANGTGKFLTTSVSIVGSVSDVWQFYGWSKAMGIGGTGSYKMTLTINHTDGSKQAASASWSAGSHDWQQKFVTLTASEAYNMVTIKIMLSKAKGSAWFDEIVLLGPP